MPKKDAVTDIVDAALQAAYTDRSRAMAKALESLIRVWIETKYPITEIEEQLRHAITYLDEYRSDDE